MGNIDFMTVAHWLRNSDGGIFGGQGLRSFGRYAQGPNGGWSLDLEAASECYRASLRARLRVLVASLAALRDAVLFKNRFDVPFGGIAGKDSALS